ncbi:MAG TPA: VCBS repeat-containing protein, partial [Chitinophagaceae bacterium]|nr:VCBS repeat-containing protein [Chitinophagaceae bacterium]
AGDPLFRAGMVNDASWVDIDKDGWKDLIIAGDWMPITVFHNEKGKRLANITEQLGLEKTNGFWHKILPADVDNDGDIDFIAGNLGNNTQFKTTADQPLVTYAGDFNDDGRIDPIMTWFIQNISYPFNSRDELVEQIPALNKKFIKYADYATATIQDILPEAQLKNARKYYIYNTQTCIFINNGGRFECKPLPAEAQFSMVQSVLYRDYDGDGKKDILLAGNFYPFRVQQGRCDAGFGCLLKAGDKGNFITDDRSIAAGLFIPGDVRDMTELNGGRKNCIVISKNNAAVQVLSCNK